MRVLLLVLITCVQGRNPFVEWFHMTKSHKFKTHVSPSYSSQWMDFKKTYGKVFEDSDSEQKRYETFQSNLKYIEDHNKLYDQGKKSFYLGINEFTDLTHEEFRRRMHLDRLMQPRSQAASTFLPPSFVQLPDEVDWRTKGYVTPVKNQGRCGSCWSFSSTGSMEGQHFKKTGNLISLSEQQLIDCSGSYGDMGCNGGLMDYAFEYIEAKGLEAEKSYPYEAKQQKCNYTQSKVVAECTGHTDVTKRSEDALKMAVATVGPVSVAIDASHQSFQLYSGGVYDEPECSSTRLDHGVLAVGYGTSSAGDDYWLVKNSWGIAWGEQGYVKMSRNKDNQCGIATQASYPLV